MRGGLAGVESLVPGFLFADHVYDRSLCEHMADKVNNCKWLRAYIVIHCRDALNS